ncbi:hypothetical protein ATANTOWER_004528 [Ataeniobius toweri]|uniref:Uncharacterized protein n=1 Tax=Ataeniobius toweri TaxID=208326 RepID=A0ABU7ATH1_9TELE|nr:hypothetical protein [Ataeniobius toweri]
MPVRLIGHLTSGRKPEYLVRTHACTGRTCKLRAERPPAGNRTRIFLLQVPDAQPPKPVRPSTNCLPPEKHRPVHPKTDLPSRTPNPPATRTYRRSSPEFLTNVIVSSKINILNFPGLLKVSAYGSKSSVKR